MIYLPKREIELPSIELPRARVAGVFTLIAKKADGTQRKLAEFENLVTDAGLNRMGIGAFRDVCVVGTGSNAPTVADAQLQSTTARTSSGAPSTPGNTAQSSPPYYGQGSAGFRFNVGTAAGNLTEVGIGWSLGPNLLDYALFARALIKDELGNPTSVTVLSDEVLDVYYALRIYPPTVDATYSINISGDSYDCITRAANVTSSSHWFVHSGRVLFTSLPGGAGVGTYNGTIGTITGQPSGVSQFFSGPSISNLAYSNNSLQQDATFNWNLDQGNVAGGIRSVYYQTHVGAYQTQFTPAIPKDATKVLSVTFRVGWARRP